MMATPIEQESPLSSARGKVSYATERVSKLSLAVSEIADVVFGMEGPQPTSGEAAPRRDGEAGLLHDDLDTLARSLDNLERQINRISSLGVRPSEQSAASYPGAGNQASAVRMGNLRAY